MKSLVAIFFLLSAGFLAANTAFGFLSTKSAIFLVGVGLLALWLVYIYSGSPMDRAYNEYLYSDEEMKKEFMASASAEIRAEIEKRERDAKNA